MSEFATVHGGPTRFSDWTTRLQAYISQPHKFEFGKWDCCLFACDCIQVMTGLDPAAELRGKYTDLKSAIALVNSVEEIADRLTKQFVMPPIPVPFARRGDLVLIPRDEDSVIGGVHLKSHHSLGIVTFDGRQLMVASDGILFIPKSSAVKAWMVG